MEMIGKIRRMHLRDRMSLNEIAKRTGISRNTVKKPLKAGEKLQPRVNADLLALKKNPALIRAFFEHPNGSYIVDQSGINDICQFSSPKVKKASTP